MNYKDLNDEGYGKMFHTGKPCAVAGCNEPAGTFWSSTLCAKHSKESQAKNEKTFSLIMDVERIENSIKKQ